MAAEKRKEKPNESPLARTAQLARKLLGVPKAEVDRQRDQEQRSGRSSANPRHC